MGYKIDKSEMLTRFISTNIVTEEEKKKTKHSHVFVQSNTILSRKRHTHEKEIDKVLKKQPEDFFKETQ